MPIVQTLFVNGSLPEHQDALHGEANGNFTAPAAVRLHDIPCGHLHRCTYPPQNTTHVDVRSSAVSELLNLISARRDIRSVQLFRGVEK